MNVSSRSLIKACVPGADDDNRAGEHVLSVEIACAAAADRLRSWRSVTADKNNPLACSRWKVLVPGLRRTNRALDMGPTDRRRLRNIRHRISTALYLNTTDRISRQADSQVQRCAVYRFQKLPLQPAKTDNDNSLNVVTKLRTQYPCSRAVTTREHATQLWFKTYSSGQSLYNYRQNYTVTSWRLDPSELDRTADSRYFDS